MEHVLTMANLKLKPSLFTPRPNEHDMKYVVSIGLCKQSSEGRIIHEINSLDMKQEEPL